MFTEITKCRVCKNTRLDLVLDLGNQVLTGIFPKTREQQIESMPLRLVKCAEQSDSDPNLHCGLLQLQHTGDLSQFYGENYGYRSGLNASMVNHLRAKVQSILRLTQPQAGDLVIDIGSNDSTTLQAYPSEGLQLVGVDPTGIKFKNYYPSHIGLIPDFFSAEKVRSILGPKKAKIITSFSMFYDLEDPLGFMKQIYKVLADDGVWVFEQSYMPKMLDQLSYDTVCHEHLEYYGLRQIQWMAQKVGLTILDVEFNDINGGSFSVTVAKAGSGH
jgi:NDP-4-keto-2,6-dideoxyhexose 3-C-methyltransferase